METKIPSIFYLQRRITMKKLKDMLPFLLVTLFSFYLLPLFIKDTGSAILILLIIIPVIGFVCSMIYGLKKPFSLFYSVIVAILFIPSIFIFYNSSAWIYTVVYGAIALIGSGIGAYISKNRK